MTSCITGLAILGQFKKKNTHKILSGIASSGERSSLNLLLMLLLLWTCNATDRLTRSNVLRPSVFAHPTSVSGWQQTLWSYQDASTDAAMASLLPDSAAAQDLWTDPGRGIGVLGGTPPSGSQDTLGPFDAS